MRTLTTSLFLFLSLALLSGCHDRSGGATGKTPVIPETHFGALPAVPSVTAPVKAATTQATATETDAAAARLQAQALTPETLQAIQPVLVDLTVRVHEGLRTTLSYLFAAQEKASQNDAAVAELTARLEATQQLVSEREKQMKAMADQHTADSQEQQKTIAKIRQQLSTENQKTSRWIFGTACGLGMIALLAGGFLFFTVMPKTLGLAAAGFGLCTVMLGTAGLYYGREIAIGGLALGVVVLVVSIWGAVHYLKQDGASIIQGLQQAIIAGKVQLSDIKEHLDMAQTPGARRLVDQETETGKYKKKSK